MEWTKAKTAVRNYWGGASLVLVLMLISSCGGGGGSASNPPPPPPPPPAPTTFSYLSSYYAYTAGPAVGDVPYLDSGTYVKNQLGRAGSWTISPALPPGLVLSQIDGSIGGQPTAASPATTYTVTNVSGAETAVATLTIAVAAAPLLNLGLSSGPSSMQLVNSRLLSAEGSPGNAFGGWLLQDFTSGATLAHGNGVGASPLYIVRWFTDLEANVMVDLTSAGLEVRSANDGSVISTIPEPLTVYWYRLATDGSYIAAGSPTALTIWSTSGEVLVSRAGNYGYGVNAYAAPGEILIANGPAGANVIETVSTPTGNSSVTPAFQGTFNSWFLDGQRFLTNLGNTVWIYSDAAVLQDFTSLTTVAGLTGIGNWFWADDGNLNIYQVGASTSPAFTTTGGGIYPSGDTIGVISTSGSGATQTSQVTVIDLSGTTPSSATFSLPNESTYGPSLYAAQSPAEWAIGYGYGIIVDDTTGQPRTLTLGAVSAIAGGTSYFSVATFLGTIFNYDASDDSPVGTLSFPTSSMFTSADGSILVALSSSAGLSGSANVYSLPSGTLLNTIPANQGFYGMSQSGSVIAEGLGSAGTSTCDTQFVPAAGGAALYCLLTGGPGFQISPDGTLVGLAETADNAGNDCNCATNIFKNGTLVTAVPGAAVVWLDNDHLLVDEGPTVENFRVEPHVFKIYDSLGNFVSNAATTTNLGSCSFDAAYLLNDCQIVSADSLFFASNLIVNYLTGALEWRSGDYFQAGGGTSTGSQIIHAAGDYVFAEPYTPN